MNDYVTLYTDSVYVLVPDEYLIIFVSHVAFEYYTDFIWTCLFLFAFFTHPFLCDSSQARLQKCVL